MEHLLTQASTELSIRSQVEATLTALLHDVETAHALEQALHAHNVQHDLRERYDALRLRYEEREAVWEAERREKERLGVAFLEELVRWSARGVREERERRAMEMQLQRLMAEREEGAGMVGVEAEDTVDQEVGQASSVKEDDRNAETVVDEVGEKHDAATSDKQGPIEHATQDDTIYPHQFNEATLMTIFAFLDPLDVMNFAQINKAMFSRINELFGMGGSAGNSDSNEAAANVSTDATVSNASNVDVSTIRPPLPPTSAASAPVVAPSSASVTSMSSTPSTGAAPKTSPKLFAMPSPSIPSIVGGPSSGSSWLSRFGATADSTSAASTTPSTKNTPPTHARSPSSSSIGSTTVPSSDPEIKLNATMANSMAAKLTPAELSIILRMREKLQKCEADAARWRQEKEDAVAKLASVEAVKEFLVTKVRDAEARVEVQREEMEEVQRKNLVDQEVIVFLDEKVNRLEKEVKDVKSREASTKQEAADIVAKNEKKVRVLSDMLRFEREQMASNEKEWKNTKKVLVKEVKSCRAHIVSLEAELEG
ncbi:hypothetical protein HJC23_005053 [Cyclotella cryptica]|uniref:F-box domain-containing protein n=1 Tax=Cyclotella cryptica TaxID=29204 RepID=A0ABD3QE28_9STRA|eukprot:CCRYP_006273-RA/>CCRYP_006273-RA protein AED:0.35 eAED:0.35 QI:0/-1/0/1/-1/1/1/0/539